MRVVLYDVEWQVLRLGCIERYHHAGGWATVEGTKHNLDMLDGYLSVHDATEYAVRQFRVNACLLSVQMGYLSTKRCDSEMSQLVTDFRDEFAREYDVKLVRKAAAEWSWRRVTLDLVMLQERDIGNFVLLMENLRRDRKPGPEREKFLMIMEKVLWLPYSRDDRP